MLLILITVVSTGKVTSDYYSLLKPFIPNSFYHCCHGENLQRIINLFVLLITMLTVFFSHIQVMLCYYVAFSTSMIHGLEFFFEFFSLPFFLETQSCNSLFVEMKIPPFRVLY